MSLGVSLLDERMQEPMHQGALQGATGIGAVGNPACGDVVTMYVRVEDDMVVEASFESVGSAYQLATASVLCDCIIGHSLDHARRRTPQCMLEKLPDLPENKTHLAHLALEALQRALQGKPPDDDDRTFLSAEDARAFVLDLLGNGRRWGTLEIDAMARAEGYAFPTATVRFLVGLRGDGAIEGAMDAQSRSWQWWLP